MARGAMNDVSAGQAYSPLSPGGDPSAPEPPPAPAASARGGTSAFAVMVGVGMLLLFAFFGLSLVAVGMRWSRGHMSSSSAPKMSSSPAPTSAPVIAPPALPEPRTEVKRAVVTVPAKLKNGVLRASPSGNAPTLAFVPMGTVVELGESRTAQSKTGPQVWYRVRAVVDGKAYEGWMHSDILRRQ